MSKVINLNEYRKKKREEELIQKYIKILNLSYELFAACSFLKQIEREENDYERRLPRSYH